METIELLVRAFWQRTRRVACAEAVAALFLGRVTVSNQEFAARSDGTDVLRYGADTALTLAVAGRAATLGPELEIDGDTATSSG